MGHGMGDNLGLGWFRPVADLRENGIGCQLTSYSGLQFNPLN